MVEGLKIFKAQYNVYYEDTDMSGYVYHANYLKFFERARTDLLPECGLPLKMTREKGFQFVVSELNVKFHQPACLNDRILVETQIIKVAGARIIFSQRAVKTDDLNQNLCQGQVVVGCVDLAFKPTRVPQDIKKELM